jgi:hypothetical protein
VAKRVISEHWRGVYRELREAGFGRLNAYLVATGMWVHLPRWFPEVRREEDE